MNYCSKPAEKLKREELNQEKHFDGNMVLLGGRSENETMKNIWLNFKIDSLPMISKGKDGYQYGHYMLHDSLGKNTA